MQVKLGTFLRTKDSKIS